jgi:hypothetical protein
VWTWTPRASASPETRRAFRLPVCSVNGAVSPNGGGAQFERLTLRSDDPPEVVQAKLVTLVATKWFSLRPPPRPFRSCVQGRHFKVVRVLGTILGCDGLGWRVVEASNRLVR